MSDAVADLESVVAAFGRPASAADSRRLRYLEAMLARALDRDGAAAQAIARRALGAMQTRTGHVEGEGSGKSAAAPEPGGVAGLLAALSERLEQAAPDDEQSGDARTLEDLLRKQAAEILRTSLSSDSLATTADDPPRELRAARALRMARPADRADGMLRRARESSPRDAGPLNPQKLAVATLTAMREISPRYHARLMAYTETLLWLGQAGKGDGRGKSG